MLSVGDLFKIENAKSKGFEYYEKGNTPFITNGDYDNSIVGFVKPMETDKVFDKICICISSFCEATIHTPPFLPRGNGGSGLIVLVPKRVMEEEEIYFYASQINMIKWKFSFSRMLIGRRIQNLKFIKYEPLKFKIKDKLKNLLPQVRVKDKIQENENIQLIKVFTLCNIEKKTSLPQNALSSQGSVPYVTTTSLNNGVSQFTDEEPNFKGKCLSIAMNGSVGEVFFQIDDFITSGDNAVLTLKDEYNPYLLLYIGVLLKNHKWRYNYSRKLSLNNLKNLELPIPIKNEKIDLDYIKSIIINSYGFDLLKQYLF
ncbi:MAG: restriction endonuclease subunit S [Rickettsia endosymbiont of Oxypoda opaca]|nr:restriction endonuclease subunit S [Rickettsia endosymbiont of Oxypoda opaca]